MKRYVSVSPSVVNRMPKYLSCIQEARAAGIEKISSTQIARMLGFTASQVRQDFSTFGSYGAQGYGYNASLLEREIKKILGLHERHNVVMIGIGSIGHALLEHMNFESYNYRVCAGFDVDPFLVGTSVNGVEIRSYEELPQYLRENNIDICILSVSGPAAKKVANILYELGVRAIWNFTNENLGLDDTDIIVQNVNFWESLFALTYYLEESYSQSSMKKCVNN